MTSNLIRLAPGYLTPDLTLATNGELPDLKTELQKRVNDIKAAEQRYGGWISTLAGLSSAVTKRRGEIIDKIGTYRAYANIAIREADPAVPAEAEYLRIMIGKGDTILEHYTLAGQIKLWFGWESRFLDVTAKIITLPLWPFEKIVKAAIPAPEASAPVNGEITVQPYDSPAPDLPDAEQKIVQPGVPTGITEEERQAIQGEAPITALPSIPAPAGDWRRIGVWVLAGMVGVIVLSELGRKK